MSTKDKSQGPNDDALAAAIKTVRSKFLAQVDTLRPRLHRYCTRMTGSVLDGEDMVQDTLVHAFYRLPSLRDDSAMSAWLFRIAHNKCIDFLRAKKPIRNADGIEDEASYVAIDRTEERQELSRALEALVGQLPPKERAAVLLKDVFDYSLSEIANIIDSSTGGVKSALHRGRTKLNGFEAEGSAEQASLREEKLLAAYVEGFNSQDWETVRTLIGQDARLELVGMQDGALGKNYFTNYQRLPWHWHLAFARVDGEAMIVHYRSDGGSWRPHAALRMTVRGGLVSVIRDYVHVDYLMEQVRVVASAPLPPTPVDA